MADIATPGSADPPGALPLDESGEAVAQSCLDEPHHVVHFYENDADLVSAVAQFLADGLAAGERVIVIATPLHREGFAQALRDRGITLGHAAENPAIAWLDAEQVLAACMVDGMPDRHRFQASVGRLLEPQPGMPVVPVRAYGEMVDVLWRQGRASAAIRLEELWNDLQRERAFSLLCAYAMAGFYKEPTVLHQVCSIHTHVVPFAGDGDSPVPGDLRTLAAEIAHGKQVERALRRALRDLRQSEHAHKTQALRSERLLRVTAAIADAVTAEQVYEALVDQVATALSASSAGLWLTHPDERSARLVRSFRYPEAAAAHYGSVSLDAAEPFPALEALRTGQPIWLDSQEELIARYPAVAAWVSSGRSYRLACMPVVVRDRILGAVAFTFDGAPPLDTEQRAFLLLVARYTGQALERLRLLEIERHNRAENARGRMRAELLYGLAAAVIGADRVEQVFDAALDAIERALGTRRSAILVFDRDGVMRFRAHRGLSDGYRAAVEGHSPWARGARAPEPVLVGDVARDPAWTDYLPLFRQEQISALGFIPLVAGGQLLGKFMVYYERPHEFAAPELDLAKAIANHAAAALARFAAIAELEQTLRWNELFTGVLGHDLRNPLAAIITAAQHALQRNRSETLIRPLTRILTSGGRMARMIDQLLDFTRVRVGGGIALHRQSFDLVPLLRQAMDELDDAHPEWSLRLEQRGATYGAWDADRLLQAFSNLIGNAVQHGVSEHGVRVRVDGGAGDAVRIEIHNKGVIAPELLPNLFEPLSGGAHRPGAQGLGLGLFITRAILSAHGGRVEVRSTADEGTTFTVLLPKASG